ncbi:rhomboid family intramembrane serine protease [Mycobacterium sp. 1164966.3]|uniref:rhomboid family intramembrane serine protease n=1 Tax=Mycobacterium sp. 1164966.3 TaxID=1856861 RepID=UPI000800DFFA|nr:rhomboid family intramembrane serine protease [Mycobacterium sp. 1164966.3]OBA84036.1 rhomboid family intramembrane serine protease [Mycobacterium sp. 1164966.3]
MSGPSVPQSPAEAPTCYRHPDRVTYVRCTRCEQPICSDCMRSAAVGHQCVECVRAGAKTIRQPRTEFGGRERSGTPVLTYVLIAINVAVFILQLSSRNLELTLAMWPWGVAKGELYRLLTSAFVHTGPAHLLLNMWALYVVGPPLEIWLGRLRYSALYALSALGGSVLVDLLAAPGSAAAGASGAIFGLFGAVFVVARRLNLDVRGVIAVIVFNLLFTFVVPAVSSHRISWQAHIGGLVTGALVAAAYVYAPKASRNLIQAGVTVAVVAVFAGLVWWRTGVLLGH